MIGKFAGGIEVPGAGGDVARVVPGQAGQGSFSVGLRDCPDLDEPVDDAGGIGVGGDAAYSSLSPGGVEPGPLASDAPGTTAVQENRRESIDT